jgi:hypothetical protein
MIIEGQRNLVELINGDKFEGILKNNGASLGQGKYFYRNGDVYEGMSHVI